MNRNELVSVIIPTFKRAEMLPRAIDSVLNQTYHNIEVIVVDDNDPNTDYRKSTQKVLSKYKDDPRVIYIQHEYNKNGAVARNTGILNSNGAYICFLDDDDWYLPQKIQKQVEFLSNNPQFDAVYCGWNRDNKKIMPKIDGDLTFEILSGTNLVYTNAIMIKKSIALKIGGWDERFKRNQEAVFLLRYFKHGYRIGAISDVLVEFDTSDRSNVSSPRNNEKDIDFFLEAHKENIINCKKKHKNAEFIIYSYRYRSVFLNYLKHKDYKNAMRLYLKMTKKIPFRFNKDLIVYTFRRII